MKYFALALLCIAVSATESYPSYSSRSRYHSPRRSTDYTSHRRSHGSYHPGLQRASAYAPTAKIDKFGHYGQYIHHSKQEEETHELEPADKFSGKTFDASKFYQG